MEEDKQFIPRTQSKCVYVCVCVRTCIDTHIAYTHLWNLYFLISTIEWSEETHDVTAADFVEPVGPAKILPYTVVGMFRLFFTTAIVATIVRETNVYARQVLGDAASEKWTDVDADDIWTSPQTHPHHLHQRQIARHHHLQARHLLLHQIPHVPRTDCGRSGP